MSTYNDENGNKVIIQNHYGKYIFSNEPVTGVIDNNNVEWLNDETDYHGINLTYEEFKKNNPRKDWEFYENSEETFLIGDWKKVNGLYEPKKRGKNLKGYSAIVSYSSNTTQIVWSKWIKKGVNYCSPCYPGQVDLDSTGDFMGYTLPDDLIGFEDNK